MSETKVALGIQNLCIDYSLGAKTQRAVDALSFEIRPGEIFGLLGPNGAGKTSVISAITGLNRDFSGEIQVFGHPAGTTFAKRKIGLVPQELVSYGFFNVQEILEFNAGYFAVRNARERIEWLLDRLQLIDVRSKKVAQLSGGMKRRLLIARALLHSPDLLLLDEPSAGVDVELREILWSFVTELNRSGTTILLTTHYLEEAENLCHRVAILSRGKLLACDETRNLVHSLKGRVLKIRLRAERDPSSFQSHSKIFDVRVEGRTLSVALASDLSMHECLTALGLRLEDIDDIQSEAARLEDAFKALIQERKNVA